jgi:hypothetical protein
MLVASRHQRQPLTEGAEPKQQPPRAELAGWAALGALGVLATAAIFAGGGAGDGSMLWIGAGALAVALGAATAALLGVTPWPAPSRAGLLSLALLAGFVLWNGASVMWSQAPDRSWDYFNRGLVYLAFAAVGLAAGTLARRASVRVVALAGKVFPTLYEDGGRIARLRAPVGFWNALALLFALAVPLALWIGTEWRRPALRALGAVFLFGLVVGLLLTYSRSGLLAGAAGAALWLGVAPRRWASLGVLVAGGVPGLAVGLWAFTQPGVADDRQEYATRVSDGAQLGVALLLGGILAWGLALALIRLEAESVRPAAARLRTVAAVAAAIVIVAGLAVLGAKAGDVSDWVEAQADDFANPPTELVTQDPARLTSVSSNNRWNWWRESWEGFRAEPLLGTGAGSFETTHRLLRDDALSVTEPHSVPLQFLSETGIVGALLAAGALGAGIAAVVGSVRRLGGPERAAATALAAGLGVYVLHSLVDWDWDFLAVTGPAFAVFGVLLVAGRPPRTAEPKGLWAMAPVLLFAPLVFTLVSPWLADRRVENAYSAVADGDAAAALSDARDARTLNPVAIDPLLARSVAEIALGELAAAERSLLRAVELQPENPDVWYELGLFELEVANRPENAVAALERAVELDSFGPAAALLERARAQ